MSEISEAIQEKCMAFVDRVIKLNDYLLMQAGKKEEVRCKTPGSKVRGQHHPSSFYPHPSRVPVYLQSIANLSNQLLRAGTSIGANNAEATMPLAKQTSKVRVSLP